MVQGKSRPVIFDGDMGGDDIWAIMMLLAHPDRFHVKGITSVFGNVDCEHATRNILNVLTYYNHSAIPVFKGASRPLRGDCMFGDDAYGQNGIGGVSFKTGGNACDGVAEDWIIETVMTSPEPVTIFGTGPYTNLAHALIKRPEIVGNIESLILMGGGLAPGPYPDVPGRSGNITVHSEFNLFQDPYAANIVFSSGIDTHLLTLDSNQHFCLDSEKKARIGAIFSQEFGDAVTAMLAPVESLDRAKFGTNGPLIQDPNVVIYALDSILYRGNRAFVAAEEHPGEVADMHLMRHGKLRAVWNGKGNVKILTDMPDPNAVFDIMERSLQGFAAKALKL